MSLSFLCLRLLILIILELIFLANSTMVSPQHYIFISRFSGIACDSFKTLVQTHTDASKTKLVYVPTASYAFDAASPRSKGEQRRRARYDAKQKMALIAETLGVPESRVLELDAATSTPEAVRTALTDARLIYVDGGNTFYLQKYLLATSFWASAKDALSKGSVYMGSSAGGIAAGLSIRTAHWKGWDDPGAAADMTWDEDTLRGAGLGAFSMFMHHGEQYEALVRARRPELDHEVVTIADNEAVVCVGGLDRVKYVLRDGVLSTSSI